jgi:glycine cleavage system H protein
MKNVPPDLKYVATHEWAKQEDQNIVTVGITDHAQNLLGDIVYVELPSVGQRVNIGEECGVVESVKAASDIYCPLSGEIIAINEDLEETPGLVNKDPYGLGWIFRIKLQKPEELGHLLDAQGYVEQIGGEEANL